MRNLYLLLSFFFLVATTTRAQQLAPVIEWQKCLGGTGDDRAAGITRTVDNGFIVVGSSKSNNGDVTGHHGSADSTDAWVVKVSATGALEWQRSFGGSGQDAFFSIIPTSDGGFACLGRTSSPDGDVTGYHGNGRWDIWVVKIDRYGNLLWQKALGGTSEENPGSIREFSDGNLMVIGSTGSQNGDVSGLHNLTPPVAFPPGDIWVVRLNGATGNLISQRCFGGTADDIGHDIAESDNGSFIIVADVNSTDGDFGTVPLNPPHGRIIKINASNTMIWQYRRSRASAVSLTKGAGRRLVVTWQLNNCYPMNPNRGLDITSFNDDPASTTAPPFFNAIASFAFCNGGTDPSAYGYGVEVPGNVAPLTNTDFVSVSTTDNPHSFPGGKGALDGFLVSGKVNDSLNWKKLIGGSGSEYLSSVVDINETAFVTVGYTNSNDGDVSGNHGGNDVWIVKMGKVNLIKGTVFADYNLNGTKDASEPVVNNLLVQSSKAGAQTASSTYSGMFTNFVDTGNYSTSIITPVPYYTVVPASQPSTFSTYNNITNLSFALQPLPGKKDYAISVFPYTPARPGFAVKYLLRVINVGTDTLNNKTVKFIKDHRVAFVSATPAQTNITVDTIRWTIASLAPRDTAIIIINGTVAAPPAVGLDDVLTSTAVIDSTGDLNGSNNLAILRERVVGSFDPNDKQEVHGDTLYKHEYDAGDYLTYTVRFQNTGTDTAFNISVKDTLSNRLDYTTFEMINASHAYTLSVTDGRYCTWTFSNILLVDSNHNEPLSHGYITYRIKPKSGLLMHDAILNSASIYFDFNEPVQTNTQQTALKPTPVTMPPQPTVSGMQTSYCKNLPAQKGKITNLPTAASGITVAVDIDDEPISVAADSTFTFTVSTLAAGPHVIQVMYLNGAGSKVAASTFTVVATATPDVNISASTTNVTNLSTPVVVTATNAAGGGTDPLYTFARNRNFTDILLAEGTLSTLSIIPSTLTIGSNWIYVRMKTSATCYAAQTNTDSINVRRDQTTGIVDIDNPAQTINVYPNPFRSPITISGLNAQKKYIVTITNLQGQQVYSRNLNNRTTMELPAIHGATGVYWLTLYDATRQRSLGSVKLIKE